LDEKLRLPEGTQTLRPTQQNISIVTRRVGEGGRRGYSLGISTPGRDADQPPTPTADVKNGWSCTSTPLIHFHEVHRELSFTLKTINLSVNASDRYFVCHLKEATAQ